MSIGYTKISEMIEQEIGNLDGLSKEQKKQIKNLCDKIYLLRGSANYRNRSRFKEEIMGEVSRFADILQSGEGKQ